MAEKTEDLNLPMAVVSRILKDALPDGVNVSKEARVAITRAASVFVLFATSTANEKATKAKRKTLAAADVIEAMKVMEFEEFVDPLKEALENWKSAQKRKKSAKAATSQEVDEEVTADEEETVEVGEIRQSPKKSRLDPEIIEPIAESDESD